MLSDITFRFMIFYYLFEVDAFLFVFYTLLYNLLSRLSYNNCPLYETYFALLLLFFTVFTRPWPMGDWGSPEEPFLIFCTCFEQ